MYRLAGFLPHSLCHRVLTISFPLWHLECADRLHLACSFGPRSDWIEGHLPVARRFTTARRAPRLVLLHRRETLGERHDGRSEFPFSSEMIPDDFSGAAASASVALRCNECCAWLPQRCLLSEARRLLGSRVRSDDVGAMKQLGGFAAQSQHERRASSRVKRTEQSGTRKTSSGSHMRHGKPTGRVVCHTSSRIWRRDLDGQAHDHAHHVRRAFTLQAALSRLRRLTVAVSSSPTSLCTLQLSVPAHKPQNAYALVIKSLISQTHLA